MTQHTINVPADIGAQVAALGAEMRSENGNTRRILDRVALAVDKLSAIEAQNQARDIAIAALAARMTKSEDKVDELAAAQAEARATFKGSVAVITVLAGVLGSCGSWLATKFGG